MSDSVTFFEAQKTIHPRSVSGRYRRIKWLITSGLLALYVILPWLRWERGAGVPDQAVLIDMGARRAYFFFIEIWPQEVYYLTGVLILAAVSLFFVTSLLGRVWCGYTCFQTIWTDLFVAVELLFQGDRNARIKLDAQPLSFNKIWRKGATHAVWLLIALLTGGVFVFYFNDAPTLAHQILTLSVSPDIYLWSLGLTFSTYIMAGFAREQICAYMCPYARFQSGMFDRDTLIISYDAERGEPRAPHKAGESWEGRGHCIDCGLCAAVCPVGIDIRNGLQMECIACGLCVDACNGVMDKIGLPQGLVRYDTENNTIGRSAAHREGRPWRDRLRLVRLRTVYYAVILLAVLGVMGGGLASRSVYEIHALHERNPLFTPLSSGGVRNSYTIKILNKTHQAQSFVLSIPDAPPGVTLKIDGAGNPDVGHLNVPADDVGSFRLMVSVPVDASLPYHFDFVATSLLDGKRIKTPSMFITGEKE